MSIRLARPDDLDAIVEILNQAIRAGVNGYTAEVTPEDRRAWLGVRDSRHPVVVMEREGVITGWAELSPYRPGRSAFRFTAEITYYVHESHRRAGVGSALVSHLVAECAAHDIHALVAILLETNRPSTALLEKHGFERWALLPKVAHVHGGDVGHVYYGRSLR